MPSSFLKNTSKLLTGDALGQVIGIIAIPIITRLYSVEDYGAFSAILAISLILTTLSTLSLHLALLIPKNEVEANKILHLSFGIMITFCMLLSGILITFKTEIVSYLDISTAEWMVYTIPMFVLFQGCYLISTYWGVRKKNFGLVSVSKVAEGLIDRTVAIAAGFAGYASTLSLVVARLLSNVLAILYLTPTFKKVPNNTDSPCIEVISYKKTIIKYKRYLQYNTPSMLLISAGSQLPVIIIAAYFSAVSAGLYAIANRIVNIPVTALGNAISKTYTQKIAEDIAEGNLPKVQRDTESFFKLLLSFLLVPFSILAVVGESLFTILLGEKWADAGVLASSLSYLAMTTLLVQGFGGIFDVMNKQNIRLVYHACNFIVRTGILVACIFLEVSLSTTILLYAVFGTVMNAIVMGLLFSCVKKRMLLFTAFRDNLIPLVIFHVLIVTVEYYITSLYLSYFFIALISFTWLLYIGSLKKVMSLIKTKKATS
ncbi:lipopolysaccharide biosynthesis protein [Paraglaciecola sp.]|uniref:lipopolysaccharide biosynthesis protein n=1 Tax=Paraglaciecola sp. TaxID=1920173 RepID=UPI003267EA5F